METHSRDHQELAQSFTAFIYMPEHATFFSFTELYTALKNCILHILFPVKLFVAAKPRCFISAVYLTLTNNCID